MKNRLFLATLFIGLAAMAIAFFATFSKSNQGFMSVLAFIIAFLGSAAMLNLINRRKRRKEEGDANE